MYYDKEEVVDELWNIKFSENYADSQKTIEEIIGTIAKCNVSENVWSDLLDRIGRQKGISLLSEIVESHSSNVVNFVDIFLQRFDASSLPARIHILVASNEGDYAADIMRVLLNDGVDPKKAVSKLGMTPVHYAAQNESSSGPKLMKILLENGGDPNTRSINHDKSTPIQLAASNQGDYAAEILKLLLDWGGKCDALTGQFEPIHFATMNGGESAPELLDLLLEKRSINIIHESSGMSLVHFTMFNNGDGGPKIAKKLFENDAKPNARDKRKQTPLHLAARDTVGENNQIAIMTAFLENGGDPNAVEELGRTPVHYAAANEGEYAQEKLKLLLNYGGKLDVRDKGGLTPIHYTILNKGTSGAEIRQLVGYKKGANIPLNSTGETLLHRLVNGNNNQIHLVQTALASGEDPNVKDSQGCTPVHVAIAEIQSSVGLDILKLLLQNRGNPNLPDNDTNNYTPVHYAASSLKEWGPKQMKILLSNGGNANAIGNEMYTPLHLAALNTGIYGPELTSILLEHGAKPNAVDLYGNTPVHAAVLNENEQVALQTIVRLLRHGGQANARDRKGRTPLHYAIVEKPNSMLKNILIEYGGNILEKDNSGMTPYRLRMSITRR